MIVQAKNHRQVLLQRLTPDDYGKLVEYLQQLGPDTLKRFGPHAFGMQAVLECFQNPENSAYVALDAETFRIIAYSIIKTGYLEHDRERLQSYGLVLDKLTDCTFAPSVADSWQSMGIGNSLFGFVLLELKARGIQRIILWGGVQCDNEKAVNYYRRNGFTTLGQFVYNGLNYDMILDIG